MGIKQILVMMAVVVSVGQSVVADDKLIADPIVEKEVREELKKPKGEPPFSIFGSGIFFIIPC